MLNYIQGEGQPDVVKKTHKELKESVSVFASAMKAMGIKKGDRVVGKYPDLLT